jgi:hypothetical protein
MPIVAAAGIDVVTAVDESGHSILRKLRFVNPMMRQQKHC